MLYIVTIQDSSYSATTAKKTVDPHHEVIQHSDVQLRYVQV